MLISCPSCPRVYRVAASTIPPGGREVSCSSCGTVWYEQGVEAEVVAVGMPLMSSAPRQQAASSQPVYQAVEHHGATAHTLQIDHMSHPSEEDVIDIEDETPVSDETRAITFSGEPNEYDWRAASHQALTVSSDRDLVDPKAAEVAIHAARQVEELLHRSGETWRWPSLSGFSKKLARRRLPEEWDTPTSAQYAAYKTRDQFRQKQRNQLTPMRRAGWTAWMMAVASLVVVVCDRDVMENIWPKTQDVYAQVLGHHDLSEGLELTNVTTRFAESVAGPVLEIKGTVVNNGQKALIPAVSLSVDGAAMDEVSRAAISPEPLPTQGERPFVIRAMIPEGSAHAALHLVAQHNVDVQPEGFFLQPEGGGWGGGIISPPPSASDK